MNFDIHFAAYNCDIQRIPTAIRSMMEREGFTLIDDQLKSLAIQNTDDIVPEIDKQSRLIRFLIRPKRNKWCVIYPTGSYADFQFFALELSKELECIAMVILRDDYAGWGYEIYKSGQTFDKYHTNPYISPTLHEREELAIEPNYGYHSELDPEALQAEYKGNPTLVAQLFNVDEQRISEYLTIRKYNSASDTHNKLFRLWGMLDIADDDFMYYEALDNADENWPHLIFIRRMSAIELEWHEHWKDVKPFTGPPLWLKRENPA